MTGYFSRLAARTGVGREGSPATHDLPPPQLVAEEIVNFVTQPERSARAPDMPSPSGEQRITPALPSVAPPPPPMSTRFALPDALVQTLADTTIRSAEAPVPSTETLARPAATPRPRRDTSTALLPADHAGPAATVGVETRIEQSAIAVVAAQGVDSPTPAASPLRPAPSFQLAASVALEEIEAETNPEHPARAADLVGQARPPASAPEFRVAPQGREEEANARQASPQRPANGQVHPRPQSAPSVRIGSIQVDVHAPLPLPPPTPPHRASALRRFYLRDW